MLGSNLKQTLSFFPKRLENEKLKEENELIKSQIENLKVLQNDYNNKLDQAAENIEIAKLNLGPSREEFIALEGEVKRIRNRYQYLKQLPETVFFSCRIEPTLRPGNFFEK